MTIDSETILLLNAYHDGELSPGESLLMEQRLAKEPELAAYARRLKVLSTKLTQDLPDDGLPERSRGAILASVMGLGELVEQESESRRAHRWSSWALAASLVIGLLGGAAGGGYAVYRSHDKATVGIVEQQIVAAHLRGLIAPEPYDIASSDGHVVKPWFNGRTTIAPVAPDFSTQGFPLIGGRVDVIGGKPVPVMVYKRNRHTISVTATEGAADEDQDNAVDGTNVVRWSGGGLTYWAVSDVNAGDLSAFVNLYKAQLPAR